MTTLDALTTVLLLAKGDPEAGLGFVFPSIAKLSEQVAECRKAGATDVKIVPVGRKRVARAKPGKCVACGVDCASRKEAREHCREYKTNEE